VVVGYNGKGQILMLRHVFHPFAPWGLPGGWLEKGEAPADCAIRELHEETGLGAELGPIVYSSFESVPAHIGIAFLASINPATIELSAEIIDADWFEPTALPEPLLPFVRKAIDAANQSMNQPMKRERGENE
jgi:ADP-ribose pyrophosphatase YjhB (NUDIX family)